MTSPQSLSAYLKVLDEWIERAKMIKEWKGWSRKIANAAADVLGDDVEVYVFGSAPRGEAIAASDVDILIVKEDVPPEKSNKLEIKLEIERKAGLPKTHPFEIHIVDREEAETYINHIRESLIRIR